MNNPRRGDICVIHTRGDGVDVYDLAEVVSVRGGYVRSYFLKGDDLFDPVHDLYLPTQTVLEITDPEMQKKAQTLWETFPAGHSWKTKEEARRAIQTVLLGWEYN